MALHDNRLAEMATGEGKTLVALLPTYLNALTGESAFVVTTNDYLARWVISLCIHVCMYVRVFVCI